MTEVDVLRVLLVVCGVGGLAGCSEPPAPARPDRAVLEVYRAPDGVTNCVDHDGAAWRALPACCPTGFSFAGFSVPAATAYPDTDSDEVRRLFRHVLCLQDLPPPG